MTFSFYSPMIAGMTGLNLGLPVAWVVKCKKCGCTINCRAIDPQVEHSEPDKAEPPPQDTVIVTCSCCWAAYRYSPAEVFKGPPGPSSNCYDHGRPNKRRRGRMPRYSSPLRSLLRFDSTGKRSSHRRSFTRRSQTASA